MDSFCQDIYFYYFVALDKTRANNKHNMKQKVYLLFLYAPQKL